MLEIQRKYLLSQGKQMQNRYKALDQKSDLVSNIPGNSQSARSREFDPRYKTEFPIKLKNK